MITKDKVTKRQAEKARSAIKAGQIIKRLQYYMLGEPATETCECGKEYEIFNVSLDELKKMEPSKVRAGLGLLGHVLPDVKEIYNHLEEPEMTEEERTDRLAEMLKSLSSASSLELEQRGIKIIKASRPELKVV